MFQIAKGTQAKMNDQYTTYFPFKASHLIELIEVLQTVGENTHFEIAACENVTRQTNSDGHKCVSNGYLSIGAPEVLRALYVRKRSLADIRGL